MLDFGSLIGHVFVIIVPKMISMQIQDAVTFGQLFWICYCILTIRLMQHTYTSALEKGNLCFWDKTLKSPSQCHIANGEV